MEMYSIRKGVLESLVLAAKNTYPDEFFSLLGGDKENGVIDEFILVPAVYGKSHAMVKTGLIPFDNRIVGSVHSHPSQNAFPSKGDLNTFARFGEIHLIIPKPFNLSNVKAFGRNGREQKLGVI